MPIARSLYLFAMPAFLVGFGLGGLSLHMASAEGLFGIKDSVTQIGSSLMEMQKNVDALQKNMNLLKETKEKLSSLSSSGGGVSGAMDAIMNKKGQ
ncbi:MAG TPA: hypothetical protein VFU48_00385 [Nitrospira sp.]|nr:hypothetical protein [Nitrospira sp.]